MMNRVLRLEYCREAQRPASAWLISGNDPGQWVEEICRWRIDEDTLQLFLLPTGAGDLSPAGVLAMAAEPLQLAVLPFALPIGAAARNVYLPVQAKLLPALSSGELLALAGDQILLFLPGSAPLVLAAEDGLRVADLLIPAPRKLENWGGALPGLSFNRRLLSVSFRAVADLGELFGEAGKEIGVDPPQKTKGGLAAGAQNMAGELFLGAAGKALQGASRWMENMPRGGSRRNLTSSVEDWVNRRFSGVAESLSKMRNRELHRLLDKLKNDPDLGLRQAIPLSSTSWHRGQASKSGSLGDRSSDFNLNRLGGGRPTDFWDIPPDLQMQLRNNYLELAKRERELGRHRRAAYIHAELLGDLNMAAMILKEGKFFREAALLYRDHLHRAVEAAACFVEGRQIAEAVAIYEKENAWEELGNLYAKLGETGNARDSWKRWSEFLIAQGDRLQAAEVLRNRLGQGEEAILVLKEAWPSHQQSMVCAERLFEWYGGEARHGDALAWLEHLNRTDLQVGQKKALMGLYGRLQGSYPDKVLKWRAEDMGRIQIAPHLEGSINAERREWIMLLGALAPEDRLLRRDGQRFLEARTSPQRATVRAAAAPIPAKSGQSELLSDFLLTAKGVRWKKAVACGNSLFVLGAVDGEVALVRSTFDGHQQLNMWKVPVLSADRDIMMHFCSHAGPHMDRIFLRAVYMNEIDVKKYPATDLQPKPALAGTPSWMSDEAAAVAYDAQGNLWTWRMTRTGMNLSSFLPEGTPRVDFETSHLEAEWAGQAPSMGMRPLLAICGESLALAFGNKLHLLSGTGAGTRSSDCFELEENVVDLIAGPSWAKAHLAVVTASQVFLCWPGQETPMWQVARELAAPKATFTHGGTLVVQEGGQVHLFDCNAKAMNARCSLPHEGGTCVAVLPGPEARTYTLVSTEGRVRTFRFSGEMLR